LRAEYTASKSVLSNVQSCWFGFKMLHALLVFTNLGTSLKEPGSKQ